jgi:hypothetical protein
MVLIGYRKHGDQYRFLLQNWWKNKPYVEVDVEYLEACDASVLFVTTPQKNISGFATNFEDLVECNVDLAEEPVRETL